MTDRTTSENTGTDKEDNRPYQGLETGLIHDGDLANPTDAISSPIFQSATYRFDEPAAISEAMKRVADKNDGRPEEMC